MGGVAHCSAFVLAVFTFVFGFCRELHRKWVPHPSRCSKGGNHRPEPWDCGDPDSNIIASESGPGSYRNLCPLGCSINNFLSSSSSIRLNGCKAGTELFDYYKQYEVAIAQLISNQLNRGVYAYTVGVYFSQLDAAHDPLRTGTDATKNPPDALPMYPVPEGPPGHKPQPKPFCPGGKCQ